MEFKRSKYSKRIRKKKRLGEFRVFGFSLDVHCGPDPEGFIVDEILNIIIPKRMYCAGGGDGEKYSFFIENLKSDQDKEYVIAEAKKIEGVSKVIAYDTVDVWHSDADLYFEKIDEIRKENGEKK